MFSRAVRFLVYGTIIQISVINSPVAADSPLTVKEPVSVDLAPDDDRDQLYPDIAHGSHTYLVTWQTGQNYHMGPTADIFASRLDESGKLLDTHPITLSTAAGSQERPQVAYSKSYFLVTWQDFRNGHDWDVYGARVSLSGEVLDSNGFLIAGGEGNQALPVVSPARDGFLVVWQDSSDSGFYQLHATLVKPDAAVLPAQTLEYHGSPKPKLWGYTPGWGYSRQSITAKKSANNTLFGGETAIVHVAGGWLLSWNDETNWAAGGKGFITRRFARLIRKKNSVYASSIEASPALALGKQAGEFASDGDSLVLYAGWPHTQRGRRYGAAVFLSGETAEPVTDSLVKDNRHQDLPGWNSGAAFLIFNRPFEPFGPVAVGYSKGVFLSAAVILPGGRTTAATNRIVGIRLDQQGKPLDDSDNGITLAESKRPLLNAAVQGSETGFLLVYQQEDEQGRQRIQAKALPGK